ncbi:hypothetical protein BKA67DRAFT_534366 [Truncatella angustata]|uniref:Uncharacterized protein n=1 Tax=Truncatella angustata TaxID=152316 RepID=A0A9P8UNC8_9PEZI|nr:uncharacterized protein BKA67DRAFT_534366 [Truncatella angustata]KAH6655441.1 hypothetical protein BKA67DRAFT_534366 [Truncatella angustata]KAH8202824.1 hypothetical protein TruAng_002987 [Truncatella angustata]
MASAFARTLPSSLSSRTIFVKCSPAPSNFTERRAILKALSTAGGKKALEVFKRLEDSSSFIAVTADPGCAKTLVDESPYKRILHVQDSATAATFATTAWGAAFRTTIADPVNVQPLEEWQGESKTDKPVGGAGLGLNSKIFTIHVFPGNAAYSHKQAISQNPLYGPWPARSGYETFVSAALRRTVPGSHMAAGLRDWDTGNQLSEDLSNSAEEGAETLLGMSTRHKKTFYEERRRKAETRIPDVMTSLAAVAESAKISASRAITTKPKETSDKPAQDLHAIVGVPAREDGHITLQDKDEHGMLESSTSQNLNTHDEASSSRRPSGTDACIWDVGNAPKRGKANASKKSSISDERLSPSKFHELFKDT